LQEELAALKDSWPQWYSYSGESTLGRLVPPGAFRGKVLGGEVFVNRESFPQNLERIAIDDLIVSAVFQQDIVERLLLGFEGVEIIFHTPERPPCVVSEHHESFHWDAAAGFAGLSRGEATDVPVPVLQHPRDPAGTDQAANKRKGIKILTRQRKVPGSWDSGGADFTTTK
jgi:hypothetical protein